MKNRIVKALASIKLGVIIIIMIGVLAARGTFVEAQYNDSAAAQKLVYNSIWMTITMVMLAVCLIAVMIDRWPWKRRHIGFVLAHIGILTIMTGSMITRRYGLDGSMSVGIGESSHFVATDEMVLAVYASLGETPGFRKVAESKIDFFLDPPTPEKPFTLPLAGGDLKVTGYYPYAFREEKVVETARAGAGAAVRFQLQNARVSLTEWLVQPAVGREAGKDLGPAKVVLATASPMNAEGRNVIVLKPMADKETVEYEIHTAREPKKVKRGKAKAGDSIETGWMGLVLRILKFMPSAEEVVTFKQTDQATPMAMSAIRISYAGREQWLAANSMLRLFSDQAAFAVTYGNARKELDFQVSLKDFHVGRYPGTMRAASYESVVNVPELGERVISMNEPLKHNGFTLYQASFQEDESGRPVVSVFSVNRDPGRWIKYLGSLIIVLGTIHLFYFKRTSGAATGKRAKDEG